MKEDNIAFHDQMRDKFMQVFTKDSDMTQMHQFEATMILGLLAIWPTFEMLQDSSIKQMVQYQLTFGAILVTTYLGIMRKSRRRILGNGNNQIEYCPIVITLGLVMLMSGAICTLGMGNAEQSILGMHNLQQFMLTGGFLIFILNRFQWKHVNRISYLSTFIHLCLQVWIGQYIINMVQMAILIHILIGISHWRIQFHYQSQQDQINAFDIEIEKGKQESLIELQQMTNELDDKYTQQTTSRANELLKKLRLLKYQQMITKTDQIKQSVHRRSKKTSLVKQNTLSMKDIPDELPETGQYIPDKSDKSDKSSPHIVFQRKNNRVNTCKTEQQGAVFSNFSNSGSISDPHVQIQEEVEMTIEDIDDLLNLLSGKKDPIWLPRYLRSAKTIKSHSEDDREQISADGKKFILSHFTQRETSFKYIEDIHNKQSEPEEELEFNHDYFKYQDKSPTRVFLENSLSLLQKFRIPTTFKLKDLNTMKEFLIKLELWYRPNLYHNQVHALDVANAAGFFLECGLQNYIDDFDAACLIISSLSHDIGHPGLNNGFMMANLSKIALLYNDQSVLENYHSFQLFKILQFEQCNITQNLSKAEFKGFRKCCLNLILDTDLTKHFQLMNKFQNYLDLSEPSSNQQDKLLVMTVAIKCADVGHGAKVLKLHKMWSRRIIEEFFLQGDLEQSLGVPISPMCDRKQSVTKSQEAFLTAIVQPMFKAFDRLLQSQQIKEICLYQIQENVEYWQKQENDQQFMRDTDLDRPANALESLQRFLNQPLSINI